MPEEDVVVKQKPRAVFMATREETTNSSPEHSQQDVAPSSHSYAPNGGVPTIELATHIEEPSVPLEAAVAPSLRTSQESSRRSPGLLWSRSADLSLTGSFTVAGRRCVVSVGEDDQLHWVPEKRSRGMPATSSKHY